MEKFKPFVAYMPLSTINAAMMAAATVIAGEKEKPFTETELQAVSERIAKLTVKLLTELRMAEKGQLLATAGDSLADAEKRAEAERGQ
jgi:hypothetical protein